MQRRRILVADDNEANRLTLRHLVETEYLQVDAASNGGEAPPKCLWEARVAPREGTEVPARAGRRLPAFLSPLTAAGGALTLASASAFLPAQRGNLQR